MMRIERFKALADSYGADMRRWPEEERDDARSLLRDFAEAQHYLDGAAGLDELVHAASLQDDLIAQPPDQQEESLRRLRMGVSVRLGTRDREAARPWFGRVFPAVSFRFGMAAGAGAAIAAGFLIGWMSGPVTAGDAIDAALLPAPLDLFAE